MTFKSSFLKDHPDSKSIANVIINSHKLKNLSYVEAMTLSNLKLKFLMNEKYPSLTLSEIKMIDKIIDKIEKNNPVN